LLNNTTAHLLFNHIGTENEIDKPFVAIIENLPFVSSVALWSISSMGMKKYLGFYFIRQKD
jgi:hypothetical protein